MAIITISRGTMSGGEALAKIIAQKTGWPALSREVVREAGEKFGISDTLLAEQLSKSPGYFSEVVTNKDQYMKAIQEALFEEHRKGSYIYHGHAGHLLLKGVPQVFKVRLIAPVEYRVRKHVEREGGTPEQAMHFIEQVDRYRKLWTLFLYNVDLSDPSMYDAVFNLNPLTLETIADMICLAVKSPEFQGNP